MLQQFEFIKVCMGENGNSHFNILAIKMTYHYGIEVSHFYGKNIMNFGYDIDYRFPRTKVHKFTTVVTQ